MSQSKPKVGDVVEIMLPNGGAAYGRVLRDASIAVYRGALEGSPPIGSRDYQFVVGIYEDALRDLPVIGNDPSVSDEDDWPPPYCVTDQITGRMSIYHHGETIPAEPEACEGLEPAAVWDLHQIVERIESSNGSDK
jgi:hypothetical protein